MRLSLFLILFYFALSSRIYSQNERGIKPNKDTMLVRGNVYAIIIGISDYKNVKDLQYADRDAQAFENFLLSEAGGKVPPINVESFINDKATRSNVGDAISMLARKSKPGDRVYFYFAGHGDMEDLTQIENGLLLLYDSPNGNYFGMNDDVLEILDLKRYLSPLAQRGVEMIFIVDACHSGNLKGGVEGVQQTASALAASWGKEYKILSCQPNQISLESAEWGGGRGLFSLEMEEGLKGMADMNNDGTITMFELQNYIQTNVAKYSEGKQIPFISGDLSKPLATVNPSVLAALKEQKAKEIPFLASANPKGNEEKFLDSLDPAGKKLYLSFRKNLEEKRLIIPADTNALRDYRLFEKSHADDPLTPMMRRNLAAALNEKFNAIVSPLLKGERSYSSRVTCRSVAVELDSCLSLLGEQHYMYSNLNARKLFMDAMALTWALTESEYNISLRPVVEKSIGLLEQSEALEPNAAYTLYGLGTHYFFVYEYDKAFAKFQRYLDLRPHDFYARYSLGLLFMKLKQYEKAQPIFEKLIADSSHIVDLYWQMAETCFNLNDKPSSLAWIKKIIGSVRDTASGYFFTGVYYSKTNNLDSAIRYYSLARKYYKTCPICDNNIGHIYLVNNRMDSARRYFNLLVAADSTDPFANFNLGTIDVMNGDYYKAINRFIYTISYSLPFLEGFITHFEIYFNKQYHISDTKLYNEFRNRVYTFNMQYAGYLFILYCYLRDARLSGLTDKIDLIFSWLFNYKEYDVFTWYHHACYKAMKGDKVAALESLEKALKLGFGTYFSLMSDGDLDSVRDTPEFKNLIRNYFPDKVHKQ